MRSRGRILVEEEKLEDGSGSVNDVFVRGSMEFSRVFRVGVENLWLLGRIPVRVAAGSAGFRV